jgi:hypothetical protein
MPDITVTFWGICTYIRDRHRFVLVNAASREIIEDNPKLAGRGIDPHFARLHIHPEDVIRIGALPIATIPGDGMLEMKLEQVLLTIANPALPTEVLAVNECVPHLSHYSNLELGPPNPSTVHGDATMAAFFDVPSGDLRGYRRHTNDSDRRGYRKDVQDGSCVNVLTTETLGDPVLTITPFGGTFSTAITLRSGASVLITNLPNPEKGADRDEDFILHFLTADTIPTDATFPRAGDAFSTCPVRDDLEDGGIGLYVGPGCSNTNYP